MNATLFSGLRPVATLALATALPLLLGSTSTSAAPADEKPTAPVQMPTVTVEESRIPRVDPDTLLTPMALVAKHLSSLDRHFLNRFTLPFVGVSTEARAQALHAQAMRARQLRNLNDTLQVTALGDPAQAKTWRRELNRLAADRR